MAKAKKKASKPRAKKVVSDLQAARREIKGARKGGACRDVRAGALLMIEAARAAAKNPDLKPAQRKRIQKEAIRASKSARGFCEQLGKKVDKAKAALAKLEQRAALKGFQGRR